MFIFDVANYVQSYSAFNSVATSLRLSISSNLSHCHSSLAHFEQTTSSSFICVKLCTNAKFDCRNFASLQKFKKQKMQKMQKKALNIKKQVRRCLV